MRPRLLLDACLSLGEPRILVVGDLAVNCEVHGQPYRAHPASPVILFQQTWENQIPAAAAGIARTAQAWGAHVTLAGILGTDLLGQQLRESLITDGVDCSPIIHTPDRLTSVFETFAGGPPQADVAAVKTVPRIDRHWRDISTSSVARMLQRLEQLDSSFNLIVMADWQLGGMTDAVRHAVMQFAKRRDIPIATVTSQSETGTTPTDATAFHLSAGVRADGHAADNDSYDPLAQRVTQRTGQSGGMLCVRTLANGALVAKETSLSAARTGRSANKPETSSDADGDARPADCSAQCRASEPASVLLETQAAVMGVACSSQLTAASMLGLAASAGQLALHDDRNESCPRLVPVGRDDLLKQLLATQTQPEDKVLARSQLLLQARAHRRLGRSVVMTAGCFDLMHAGHLVSLQAARQLGDCLVVAVNSDASVRGLTKGPDRPVNSEAHRALMLAGLSFVDMVTIFDEATPIDLLRELRPDWLAKEGNDNPAEIVGRDLVESYGGRVAAVGHLPGMSSTEMLQRILRAAKSEQQSTLEGSVTDRRVA